MKGCETKPGDRRLQGRCTRQGYVGALLTAETRDATLVAQMDTGPLVRYSKV